METKNDYLRLQRDNLRAIENKAGYANNGMLINFVPSKPGYKAYAEYVRSLCDLEKAISLCLARLSALVCLETLGDEKEVEE